MIEGLEEYTPVSIPVVARKVTQLYMGNRTPETYAATAEIMEALGRIMSVIGTTQTVLGEVIANARIGNNKPAEALYEVLLLVECTEVKK